MKAFSIFTLAIVVVGCATTSGNYIVSARDINGNDLTKGARLMAAGSGIYMARNALCMNYPKSMVVIRDAKTGQELQGESPHQC